MLFYITKIMVITIFLLFLCLGTSSFVASPFALTRALRARRARPQSGRFSCFAAARAACVSTWLGELRLHNRDRRET